MYTWLSMREPSGGHISSRARTALPFIHSLPALALHRIASHPSTTCQPCNPASSNGDGDGNGKVTSGDASYVFARPAARSACHLSSPLPSLLLASLRSFSPSFLPALRAARVVPSSLTAPARHRLPAAQLNPSNNDAAWRPVRRCVCQTFNITSYRRLHSSARHARA